MEVTCQRLLKMFIVIDIGGLIILASDRYYAVVCDFAYQKMFNSVFI